MFNKVFLQMNYIFVLVFYLSIFRLSVTQSNGQTTTGANSGDNSGTTNSGTNTATNNGDGTQGYNQGYSYNTGIRPYQTGFTFYQPFGDAANGQNNAGAGNTGAKTGGAAAPVAQPVVPIGYQPVYAVQQGAVPVQPVQFQNAPQIVHFGQIPTQGVQPIPVQPIQLPNFDGGIPLLGDFGLGGSTQNNNNNNNNRRRQNNNRGGGGGGVPNVGADFNPADFGIDLGGVGGGNNNNNNNNNNFFSPPTNNNGYDSLPDDSSLANFANLGGGGGGQSNDYPDNDFGNLGDFGSATQNRGSFDILPNFGSGFFRRK